MENLFQRVECLARPRVLTEAAAHAQHTYDRDRDLPVLLGQPGRGHGAHGARSSDDSIRPGPAILQLLDLEAAQNTARKKGHDRYRVAAHISVLTALRAEYQALRQTLVGIT